MDLLRWFRREARIRGHVETGPAGLKASTMNEGFARLAALAGVEVPYTFAPMARQIDEHVQANFDAIMDGLDARLRRDME